MIWAQLEEKSVKYGTYICVILALLGGLSTAEAQRATERFIPIGRSPGVSGVSTRVGTIETVDATEGHLTLATPTGSVRVQVAEDTHVWLDKSQIGETNQVGSWSDLHAGQRIEVKFESNDPESTAEWIKIEILE